MHLHFYEFLRLIPKNKLTTYGDLAKFFGIPNSSRYIGKLLNSNKNPEIFPCYKVVNSNGNLGGFALGTNEKVNRLKKLGFKIKDGKIADFEKVRWQPKLRNYFIGIPLENHAKAKFIELQNKLKKIIPKDIVSFQKPETPHITLHFFGDLELMQLAKIVSKLKKREKERIIQKPSLYFEEINFFGPENKRKLCYLKCTKNENKLINLYNFFVQYLGFQINHKFQPHITIFRIKNPNEFKKHEKQISEICKQFKLKIYTEKIRLYSAIDNNNQTPLLDFELN